MVDITGYELALPLPEIDWEPLPVEGISDVVPKPLQRGRRIDLGSKPVGKGRRPDVGDVLHLPLVRQVGFHQPVDHLRVYQRAVACDAHDGLGPEGEGRLVEAVDHVGLATGVVLDGLGTGKAPDGLVAPFIGNGYDHVLQKLGLAKPCDDMPGHGPAHDLRQHLARQPTGAHMDLNDSDYSSHMQPLRAILIFRTNSCIAYLENASRTLCTAPMTSSTSESFMPGNSGSERIRS